MIQASTLRAMTIVEAMEDIERKLSREKGSFTLFALFERQDVWDRWDLLVVAPWVEEDKDFAIRLIADEMKARLSVNERVRISRIVLLDPSDPNVRALTSEHKVEHGRVEIAQGSRYGFPAERGYVFTAQAA